ncbi:hypothetical protein RFM68_26555 [Mesorhizobium sp. MSK_1335]|uniref:SGNH hydrolase-type esterase domain-containing protein n=1 Tax=Mesorhizobium montanum TaxID=3072323 RepID=A0ABU4ZRL2_9HYPH|nr:hypothetical protein [Mesorhizobium sp. MSK_1335]MDX8528045.1 hypothetical protein [Mesorhizobium sp. MSK_1335]
MEKLSYRDFKAMVMDPHVPDSDIAPYLKAIPEASGPFAPRVAPDPDKVYLTAEGQLDIQSAVDWGNAISRWRRHQAFNLAITDGVRKPVLVSEGDSWFQFPLLIEDVVDHLGKDYLIWSLDAGGDTADNMINQNPEYMPNLQAQKANHVKGYMFSGAGNDILGEDSNGNPVIWKLLKQHVPGKDAAWHVDMSALNSALARLETDYRKMVRTIRSDPDFLRLPIFIHGYDYAIPAGFPGDTRNPEWESPHDKWLGGPMRQKGIADPVLQQGIMRVLVDHLYNMLESVAGNSAATRVYLVDVRNKLHNGSWADEIHGTSSGFGNVAAKFKEVIGRNI